MKKITLLFTIICTGQLFGMEPECMNMETKCIGELPRELQKEITQATIASSKSLDEAIEMIQKISASFGVQYDTLFADLKDFTKLAHLLADKFNTSTEIVAKTFNTPTAKEYINLNHKLYKAFYGPKIINSVTNCIKQGADVNYTETYHQGIHPILFTAIATGEPEAVKLLLDSGANPNIPFDHGNYKETVLEYLDDRTMSLETNEKIEKLLKEAMEKKQMENQ